MKAKLEFLIGLAIIIGTVLNNWSAFSWIKYLVGLIAVIFFWGICIKENTKKDSPKAGEI